MVHTFHIDDTYMAIDVNSGAVHVLDALAYQVVGCLDDAGAVRDTGTLDNLRAVHSPEAVEEALSELADLTREGLLFTADPYRDMLPVWNKSTVIKALCLHIAHDCNLRCKYCFAGTGEYMGRRALMSAEVGKKAIDFLLENSGNRKNLEVDFFGGEPLLNLQVIKDIVAYAQEREEIGRAHV